MSKSDAFETALLGLIFQNANIANIGDVTGLRASTTTGSLYVSLHTADPGDAGTQSTSECTYTGYARMPVARTSGGWTLSGNAVNLTAAVSFANPSNATNLPQTATYWGIGASSTGTGLLLYSGAISPSIVISNTGTTPQLTTGSTVTED